MGRGALVIRAVTAALAVALLAAPTAGAAAPARQLADLTDGTAILRYEGSAAQAIIAAQAAGLRHRETFDKLGMIVVSGDAAALRRAATSDAIAAAHMDRALPLLLHESVPLVYEVQPGETPAEWTRGFDGTGVNVAVVDSGVDGMHPDLENRVVKNHKVLFDRVVECPNPCDSDTSSGHGTHVAGIVAGDGTFSDGYYKGVAPGAGIIGYSTGEGASVVIASALASFEHILDHPELNVVAVNNSWGGDQARFDSENPVNVGSKALHDAGVTVVFAAGNSGSGSRDDSANGGRWAGASECDTVEDGGERENGEGSCTISQYSVAPWVIGVANMRKDHEGGLAGQPLNFSSSRGDPVPQTAITGETIEYKPTLTAPGTNIWAAADPTSPLSYSCGAVAEVDACQPPDGHPEWAAMYEPLSGTSMAAPHVAGGVAVIQGAAKQVLGRLLTPDEVKNVLTGSAVPMTQPDVFWDWPCGYPLFFGCGERIPDLMTGIPYQDWQVGAGGMSVARAVAAVEAMAAPEPTPAATPAGERAPTSVAHSQAPPPPEPLARRPDGARASIAVMRPSARRAALRRCNASAPKTKTKKARRQALRRCARRYGRRR